MPCVVCQCSQFTRKIMNALNIEELAKASPDASDIDLSFDEIARLQRADKINTKLVNALERIHATIGKSRPTNLSGNVAIMFDEIGDLLAEAKEVNDA